MVIFEGFSQYIYIYILNIEYCLKFGLLVSYEKNRSQDTPSEATVLCVPMGSKAEEAGLMPGDRLEAGEPWSWEKVWSFFVDGKGVSGELTYWLEKSKWSAVDS